ncbi:MAG: DNA repair exonuclease [Ignavibacteriae bacterium]|nr:DNA repair exonuclease [Ignavibacteriota bacterium]
MAITFIHISDTHLGFSDLDIQDAANKNIREEDVYKAFSDSVDIILREKPDFVLHSGDIFHRSSPPNRAMIVAAQQLQRITNVGIPFYMIAGNHDYPKSVFTSPIHDLYKTSDLIHIIHKEELEIIETEEYILHMLPHTNSERNFIEEVNKIKINNTNKPNILAMHIAVSSYAMNEFGECVFPIDKINILRQFNYVGLGHWHKFQHLKKWGNVYYSGSTERTSDTQTGYDKGIIKVSIDKSITNIEFIPLNLRRYDKIKVDKCDLKSREEIIELVKAEAYSSKIHGGLFHIQLLDLPNDRINDIPRSVFDDIFEEALYYSVSKTIKGTKESISIDSESFDLKEYFFSELQNSFKGKELKKVTDFSRKLWEELEEEEENADQ